MSRAVRTLLVGLVALGATGLGSPARAMDAKPLLYSLLIPGLGEWSLGYRSRAVAHFAVEAGTWSANLYYRDRALQKRKDYEAYADAHWTELRWRSAWTDELTGQPGAWDALLPTAVEFDETHPGYLESHFASYAEDPQHYYENLGKYDWYRWGWDDYDVGSDGSENRYVYLRMRNASDDDFNVAKNFVTVMVLARVVSLVDTYIILHRAEGGADRADLERAWHLDLAPADPVRGGVRIALRRSW